MSLDKQGVYMMKDLKRVLDNHFKLLSMINDKSLPIKSILIQDVETMRGILNQGSFSKKKAEVEK